VARPAATLVLLRQCASGAPGIEILMLERSAKADFTPSMFVFPGGGVEPEDTSPEAARLTPRLSPAQALQRLPDAGSPAQALGYYVAAVRETFEESGMLLARTESGAPADLPDARLAIGRKACLAGTSGFLKWMAGERLTLAAEDLIYFAHWITPKAVPKRFDTRFFMAEAPRNTPVQTDQAEIVAHRWATPEEAIAAHAAGRMPMIEPTFHNVMLFKGCASPAEAKAAFSQRAVRPVMPQLATLPDGRRKVILPWDPAYMPEPEST
jgi:8-oxo-dGTP pyrophosphatase MutT (NUDIX family)